MKYRDYVVKPSFIVDKKIHWKKTGNGEFIIGVKEEQEFFICEK